MGSSQVAQLIVQLKDPRLNKEECDREYLRLLHELKHNPAIDKVHRVPMPAPSAAALAASSEISKSALTFVKNFLTAEISSDNLKPALRSLYSRLVRKTIELEVEANGRRLKVTASSPEDLEIAVHHAQKFVEQAPISQEGVK